MKALSLSEAKIKLSSLVSLVNKTNNELVITKNGRPAAVLISPDEFESWQETISIQQSAELSKEIKKGLKQLNQKKYKTFSAQQLNRLLD